jgi:hypothetical protein
MNNQSIVEINISKTFLTIAKNSIGTKMFQNFYGTINGKPKDLVKNGNLSCAFFISTLLHFFKLINDPHLTVAGLLKDMEASNWQKVRHAKIGDILIWEPVDFGSGINHAHVGIFVGQNKAISNNSKTGKPVRHHFTFGTKAGKPKRRIVTIYRHHLINQ